MKTWLLILFTICMAACDCVQELDGVVVDDKNSTPLSGVKVWQPSQPQEEMLTDSTGTFDVFEIMGGGNCPDIVLNFEKEGYQSLEKTFPAENFSTIEVIRLEKQ